MLSDCKIRKKKLQENTEIFESFVQGKFPVPSWNKLILLDFFEKNKLYFKEGLFAQDSLQSFETALVFKYCFFLTKMTPISTIFTKIL